VGHVDERDPDFLLEGLELDLQTFAELRVEGTERLVEQEHRGVEDQGASEGDALLLASRELRGPPRAEAGERDQLERATDLIAHLLFGHVLVLEAERNVLLDREVREQRVVLEDGVHVSLVRWRLCHIDAIEQDLTLRWSLEPGDHAQRRRLSAPRGSEQ
jgi:hypothetical protein